MAQKQNRFRLTHLRPLRASLLLVLLVASITCAAATVSVVKLRYAEARDVATALDGLLEPGASVSVYQNQLLISASPDHTEELKRIIEVLDAPPRNLLISVRQPQDFQSRQDELSLSGRIGNGNTQVVINPDGTVTENRTTVKVISRGSSGSNNAGHSVKAMEGHDAYIRMGALVPYTYTGRDQQGRPVQQTTYRQADRGFWVNARVAGDKVIISVMTSNDKAQKRSVKVQQLNTHVSGRLGQWLAIGSLGNEESQSDSGIGLYGSSSGGQAGLIYIKVDVAD